MSDDVASYSNVANINRVMAGLKGNPGRLQGGNPAPKLSFVDGNPPMAERAQSESTSNEKLPILDPWVNRRLNGKK